MREIKLVPLKLSKQIKVVLVDDEDYEKVQQHQWYEYEYKRTSYAKAIIDGKSISMQEFILPSPPGFLVDHKNGEGLDNRRFNLRHATLQQQRQNVRKHNNSTSKYKGVSWCNDRDKWVVQICINGKQTNLGRFYSEETAARIYDEAAKKYFGEFAKLNFPDKKIGGD